MGRYPARRTYMRIGKQKDIIKPKSSVKRPLRDRLRLGRWQLAALILIAVAAISWTLIALSNGSISTVTRTLSIPGLPSALEGYTIVHISDLNGARFGDGQENLVKAISAVDYDAICMTGDMVGESGDARPLLELIDGLDTSRPIMLITGDSDPAPLAAEPDEEGSLYADYIKELLARGVTYLDSPVSVKEGDATVWFSPALALNMNTQEYLASMQARYDATMKDAEADAGAVAEAAYQLSCAQKLKAAAQTMQSTDVHITLSHVPLSDDFVRSLQYAEGDLTADSLSEERGMFLRLIDVALCGHYVGGQWRLPFVGALFVPDERLPRGGWLPDGAQVSGLRRSNSVYIYTTTGLGASSAYALPGFRLFNSPEIVVIKLTAQLGV